MLCCSHPTPGFAYLLNFTDAQSSVLSNANLKLIVSPPFQKGEDKLTIPVTYDETYGTIHTNFTVPSDADIRDYTVKLVNQTSSGNKGISSSRIVVGDPRPPTAQLTVSTPDFVTPEGPLNVSASAQSFLGSSVALAEITVQWTLPEGVSGTGTIITDADGQGSIEVDIS